MNAPRLIQLAFDSMGRHYDETGNFTDWWDGSTVEAFKAKAQCFVDQYHKFTVPNPNGEPLHVNGRLTRGENIADVGGLNAAFAAWKDAEATKPGQLLPGLQTFTKEQVFFISYANGWCGKMRPEVGVEIVYQDPHAPSRFRILGTVANSPDFRESFSVSDFPSPSFPTSFPDSISKMNLLIEELAVSGQGADLRVVVI